MNEDLTEDIYGDEEENDITSFLFETGCKFNIHQSGVVCPKDSRKGKCAKCGWNPTVEKKRKEQIRRRFKDYVH